MLNVYILLERRFFPLLGKLLIIATLALIVTCTPTGFSYSYAQSDATDKDSICNCYNEQDIQIYTHLQKYLPDSNVVIKGKINQNPENNTVTITVTKIDSDMLVFKTTLPVTDGKFETRNFNISDAGDYFIEATANFNDKYVKGSTTISVIDFFELISPDNAFDSGFWFVVLLFSWIFFVIVLTFVVYAQTVFRVPVESNRRLVTYGQTTEDEDNVKFSTIHRLWNWLSGKYPNAIPSQNKFEYPDRLVENNRRLDQKLSNWFQRRFVSGNPIRSGIFLIIFTQIIAISLTLFILVDFQIGTNSPVGLVIKDVENYEDSKSNMPRLTLFPINNGESHWVINIGGLPLDNYQTGIQIPVFVIVLGIVGGYLKVLHYYQQPWLIQSFKVSIRRHYKHLFMGLCSIDDKTRLMDYLVRILMGVRDREMLEIKMDELKGFDDKLKAYGLPGDKDRNKITLGWELLWLRRRVWFNKNIEFIIVVLLSPVFAATAYLILAPGGINEIQHPFAMAVVSLAVGFSTQIITERLQFAFRKYND